MSVTIKTFGWQSGHLGQISKINQGLLDIGCVLTDNNPDIVYKNEDRYDEALEFVSKLSRRPYIIFNVLDLQLGNPNWPMGKVIEQLKQADAITCISNTVKTQIKNVLGLNSVNISNPINNVYYLPDIKKDIIGIFVGRANSPNKRVHSLLYPVYLTLKNSFGENCIHFVGPENPGFGVWHGVVSEEELNLLYNRSLFGFICSKEEGLNLPMIEMFYTNVKPIICEDMSTAAEFGLKELICKPSTDGIIAKMREIGQNLSYFDNLCQQKSLSFGNLFERTFVANNIINIYQAGRGSLVA